MAADGGPLGAWRSEESTTRGVEGGGELLCDAWKLAGRRWHGDGPERRRAGSADGRRGKQGSRQEEGEVDLFAISENSRDPDVKQQ